MNATFLNISYMVWGAICLGVALLYSLVWPRLKPGKAKRPLWMHLILRWFHALVWVLIAGACFLLSAGAIPSLAGGVAFAGLVAYIIFMIAFIMDRRNNC